MKNSYPKKSFGGRRDDKKGGRGKGGSDTWERGNRDDRPTMHSAVCSSCNSDCEVPFRPNGKKPVFCTDCFRAEESDAPRSRSVEQRQEKRTSFDRPAPRSGGNEDVVKQLKSLNDKLDKILSAITELIEGEDEEDFDDEDEFENEVVEVIEMGEDEEEETEYDENALKFD